ncbi:glycine-rich domain-containing protein [Paracoccus litorisediminis]|uniref:glycine-rich domain-containing protein n=1 Tax=Paracoccus litorisediminis TaxID=2006130 RepID=UPI00372E6F4F
MFLGLGLGLPATPFLMRSALPLLVVTGGMITPFHRSGVDYIEVAFSASGSFRVVGAANVPGGAVWKRGLGAGGATGARSTNSIYLPGPGGAGGLIDSDPIALVDGDYIASIGAGGAAIVTSVNIANQGSDSTLLHPGGLLETALGGGYGAISGSYANAGPGGSGGGARAQTNATGTNINFGTGAPGQGYPGGSANSSSTSSNAAPGGSGGAGGPGGNAAAGVVGAAGLGKLLDWLATPTMVCEGERGVLLSESGLASADRVLGSGSRGALLANVGKGGDGFLFARFLASQFDVRMAA